MMNTVSSEGLGMHLHFKRATEGIYKWYLTWFN